MRGIVRRQGFVLPTVVVASIVLLMVLVAALQLASSTAAALREQYYNQLAKEAAEAGSVMATACLQNNNMLAAWTSDKPLTPQTNCDGTVMSSRRADIMTSGNIRTRFVVSLPDSGPAPQTVLATGYAELLRASDKQVVKSYSYVQKIITGSQQRVNTVALGYYQSGSTFLATIDGQGKVRSVGANNHGQLGNGAINAQGEAYPAVFGSTMSGAGVGVAVQLYTGFQLYGSALFVRNTDGEVWGSGGNQLGLVGDDGAPLGAVKTPVKFQLPVGVKARSVATGSATFVLGSDNNIYAAGDCRAGLIGNGVLYDDYCRPVSRPVRVALPTPNPSDPNTIPTEEIITNGRTAYVRMQGGAVYGWGSNVDYQLERPGVSHISTPVRIGNFGQSGHPQATQMAFNGNTFYVVANNSKVYAVGNSSRGEAGKHFYGSFVHFNYGNVCMDRYDAGGVSLCQTGNPTGMMLEMNHKGEIKTDGKCLSNKDHNLRDLQFLDCNGTPEQQWKLMPHDSNLSGYNRIALNNANNAHVDKCVALVGTSIRRIITLTDCGKAENQIRFLLPQVREIPGLSNVAQVSSGGRFAVFRLHNGEVWGIGYNEQHVLGNSDPGANEQYVNKPVRFNLPLGVRAVDVYATAYGTTSNNVFVVGDNGKIYGTGHNNYGQLGNGTTFQQTAKGQVVEMKEFGTIGTSPKAVSVQSVNGTTVIFTKDGQVYTVGRNYQSQLGDGTRTSRNVPIRGEYINQPMRHSVFY